MDCAEPENSGNIDDTEMSPTADEEEDGEECESDTQYNVSLYLHSEYTNTLNPENLGVCTWFKYDLLSFLFSYLLLPKLDSRL